MRDRGDAPMSEVLALLGQSLSFSTSPADLTALRLALFRDRALWSRLYDEASPLGLVTALVARSDARGLLPPAGDDPQSLGNTLRAKWAGHLARRESLRAGLIEIVARLNARGIEPMILKGGQSLWTGEPQWRFFRDIDLLVPAGDAATAQAELIAMGFGPSREARERPGHHHLALLYRPDFPAWIEIHRKGGNRYAERFLSTRVLHETARISRLWTARGRGSCPSRSGVAPRTASITMSATAPMRAER